MKLDTTYNLIASIGAVCLLASTPAAANGEMTNQPEGLHGSLGLGVTSRPEYDGARDRKTRLQPSIALFYGDSLFLTGMTAGANLIRQRTAGNTTLTAGPLLALRSGRKEGDHPALAGLGEIDRGVDGGAFVRLQMDAWQLRAEVHTGMDGEDTGTTTHFSASHGWRPNQELRVRTSIDATWASSDHMSKYYGINALQAANSGLLQYQADAGFKSLGASVTAEHGLTREWVGFTSLRYKRLLGDAGNSPIVADLGNRNQVAVTAGLKFRF